MMESDRELLAQHGIDYVESRNNKFTTTCQHCNGGYLNVEKKKTGWVWYCHECEKGGGVSNDKPQRTNGKGRDSGIDWDHPSKVFDYPDEGGKRLFQVLRFDPPGAAKRFFQRTGPDQTKWSIKGVRLVPYRLPELIEAVAADHVVFVVEGEKDVETLLARNVPATTNPMGAGKWQPEFNKFLQGADVVIVPDNDQPGRDHAQMVAKNLHGNIAKRVRVLDLKNHWPKIKPSDDITDWFNAGGSVEQLWSIVEALPDWKADESKANNKQQQGDEIVIIRAADVEMKEIDWLWTNHLARGKLAIFTGDSELGKSQISTDLVARVTKIGEWPDGSSAPLGNALILSSEDAIDDTVTPRLAAAGADLNRVYCISFVKTADALRTFSLQNDLQRLGEKIREIGDVAIVVIDPVTAYMGAKIDSHRTTEVRATLEPLQKFAEQFNVAVLLISHPQKAPAGKALNAVTGSGAFMHAPRTAFLAIKDPDDPSRNLFLPIKINIGTKAEGRGYRIESRFVGPNQNILTSAIVWDSLPVRITADQALEQAAEKRRGSSSAEAKEFLREELEAGPKPAKDLEEKAEALGISKITLKRARKKLDVKAEKDGFQGAWILKLPTFRIVGPAKGCHCIHCHSAEGPVFKIAPRVPGGKSETLHESCAAEWFRVVTP